MSATMSSVAESPKIQNTQVKPKAPRKPTLAAKYNKMLVFGFSLVESLRAKGVFSDELVEQVFAELHLMSPLDDQVSYYESVLSQASANAKVMKKFIAAKNKPVKEPKVRKPRAKKTVTVQSDASDDDVIQNLVDAARNETKEKKPRKNAKKAEVEETKPKGKAKKAKVETEAPAAAAPPAAAPPAAAPPAAAPPAAAPPAVEEPRPKGKAKKAKVEEAPVVEEPKTKAKAKKVKAETPVLDSPAPAVEPPKPKPKAKKPEPEPVVQDDDDDDEEILTKETTIDGQLFLIDQNNNLYDPVSHQFIRSL
jgi:hypothetical protein